MKKVYVNQINKMLSDPDVKGKSVLRKLLWHNTVIPKYAVGDCFIVTDSGHRVFGVPVKST